MLALGFIIQYSSRLANICSLFDVVLWIVQSLTLPAKANSTEERRDLFLNVVKIRQRPKGLSDKNMQMESFCPDTLVDLPRESKSSSMATIHKGKEESWSSERS